MKSICIEALTTRVRNCCTQVAPVDRFWLYAIMTSFPQECVFCGFRSYCSTCSGQVPQKTIFGDWIGVFKPHSPNTKNMRIIKTTASIPTKFCAATKNTKYPSWVVWTHTSQIQHCGRLPSWRNRKIAILRPPLERLRRNLAQWCSSILLTRPSITFMFLWLAAFPTNF